MRKILNLQTVLEVFLGSVFSLVITVSVMADTPDSSQSLLQPAPPRSDTSVSSTPDVQSIVPTDYVTVSAEDWQKMQAEVANIKKQIESDKLKAMQAKEAEAQKKYKTPQVKIGGKILWDTAFVSLDDQAEIACNADEENGTRLRQAWIDLTGSMYDMVNYRLTYDISNSSLKDVWIGLYNLPSGIDMKVGHMKEPWSAEEFTGSTETTFMERSFLNCMRGICGSRNNGILVSNWRMADRFSWASGIFASSMKEDALNSYGENGHLAFTMRATYLPFYEENCAGQKFLLHFGGSYSYRHFDQEKAKDYGTRCNFQSNSSIAPSALDTGVLTGLDSMNAVAFELFWMRGPFSIDCEQGIFFMEDDLVGNAMVQGGYVQTSYILTGESRNYRKDGGFYGGLRPNNPFVRTCKDGIGVFSGPGAWEIAYMFTWIDTNELAPGYASATNHVGTFGDSLMSIWGLNWHLNENCKIMFNYALVHTDYAGYNSKGVNIDGTEGWEHVFGTRFHVRF